VKKKKTRIPEKIKVLVRERAGNRCEYCTDFWLYSASQFHIDHIISEQHKGPSTLENLAFACSPCNLFKGTNLTTTISGQDEYVNLYHPRKDIWTDHFSLRPDGRIIGLTVTGEATLELLRFNTTEQITARAELLRLGIMESTG